MASKFQKGVVIATVADVIIALGVIILVGIKVAEEVPTGLTSSPITQSTTPNLPSSTTPTLKILPLIAQTSTISTTVDVEDISSTIAITGISDEAVEADESITPAPYSQAVDGPSSSKISGYYNVIIAILSSRIFASLLIFIGHRMDIPELLKSHLDMSIPLTVLNFSVYIFILAEGSLHKEFTALMTFYVILRKIVLVVEFLHINHVNAESIVPKVSVRYTDSAVEAFDSTRNEPL